MFALQLASTSTPGTLVSLGELLGEESSCRIMSSWALNSVLNAYCDDGDLSYFQATLMLFSYVLIIVCVNLES